MSEAKNLEKELHASEIEYLRAVKKGNPEQDTLWRKYQDTKRRYIEDID